VQTGGEAGSQASASEKFNWSSKPDNAETRCGLPSTLDASEMTIASILRVLAIAAVAGVALAQSPQRFESEQITPEQVQTYFEEARALPSAQVFDHAAPNQVLVQVPKQDAVFIFTAKTHPAHPAVVKRELVVSSNGDVRFGRQSYFAGSKDAYDAWLSEFDELERRNREVIQRRLQGSPK
jgi:hypothetical protein